MKTIQLADNEVGDGHKTYIIAEIGGNFTTFDEAKKLIDTAHASGADAIKLQTFRADTIASKSATYDMPNTGPGANQHELFRKYEIDEGLHKAIWEYAGSQMITIFSTPSHMADVGLLQRLDCPFYKIGSDDACNIPFLLEVASVKKPIILSTGMCTMNEVRESVSAILGTGNDQLILLHCVTNYPAEHHSQNLRCIPEMKKEFGLPVGFSDHTQGIVCCVAAAALDANVLEKHFTYDRNAVGPDHMLSCEPHELRLLVENVRLVEEALGDGVKRPSSEERKTRRNNRKSIVSTHQILRGQTILGSMVAIKRPGTGIPPKFINEVIGRVAQTNIAHEQPISWDMI